MRTLATAFFVLLFVGFTTAAAGDPIDELTASMESEEGFVTVHYDEEEGRFFLEIDRLGEDFLYLTALATGSGTVSPMLDRGQIDSEYIGRFLRQGDRVYFELQNPRFTASDAENEALVRSVEESFAKSVIASFEIVEKEEGRFLVDATDFFTSDALGIQRSLQEAEQGSYTHDPERSYIHKARAFPENTEIQTAVTYAADDPSAEMRSHVPDGRYLTHRIHHSLVALPQEGYEPRDLDPRVGYFSVERYDFARDFDEDYVQRYAVRHRLEKTDPEAEVSDVEEPIVYYVDPAIPEPYREAFFEGFEWYAGLFEAAGFRNAFEVRDMPEDMDPMDARYNTVVWVHRSGPGASVGPTFTDPRTGEIIKATVRMDSHRSLVNFSMFQAYSPAFGEDFDTGEFAMARRRQHAAHEIGHTLGLAHNFIAESYGRASVMDYPAPRLRLTDEGLVDISEAYSPGPGAYDSLAIEWGYAEFAEEAEEEAGLQEIVEEVIERDLEFITHPWQGISGSHPRAGTWALSEEPLSEFEEALEVRQVLMEHFDESALLEEEPLWRMNERFNHVYFYHRFMLDALTKYLGGYAFQYSIKGDGRGAGEVVPAEEQWQALELLMNALEAEHLRIPEHVVEQMAPRPYGYSDHDLAINTAGAPAFDQLDPARAFARLLFDQLLGPERVARVVAFADRDSDMPAMEEVVDYLIDRVWERETGEQPTYDIVAQRALTTALMELSGSDDAVYEAQAAADYGLDRIRELLEGPAPEEARLRSHQRRTAREIERFFRDGTIPEQPDPPTSIPAFI